MAVPVGLLAIAAGLLVAALATGSLALLYATMGACGVTLLALATVVLRHQRQAPHGTEPDDGATGA